MTRIRRLRSVFVLLLAFGAGLTLAPAEPPPQRLDRAETVPEARAMVQLRDRWFLLNPVGRAAVDFYYRWSPYAAFAVEQPERGRLKALAGTGIAGLRGLFVFAFLWMPAAGALIVLWVAAACTALLRRMPRAGPVIARHRVRLLVVAVAAFLGWVGWEWLGPAAVAKRALLGEVRVAFERGDFPPELVARCRSDADADVRYELLYALAERPAPADRELFQAALADPDLRVRTWAMNGVGNLRDATAVPALLAALADPLYNIRYRAAWALGEIGDPGAVRPLTDLLRREEHVYVRYYAADALDRLAGRKGGK